MKKNRATSGSCRGFHRKLAATATAICLLLDCIPAAAQTLDEQYDFYLRTRCRNMNFANAGTTGAPSISASDAGPNLRGYCSPAGSTAQDTRPTTLLGGAAWSGAGQEVQSGADAAARRRREVLSGTGADDNTTQLAKLGAAAVFATFDYRHDRQVQSTWEPGSITRAVSAVLGIDRRFGSQGVLGAALRLERVTGDIDSGGDFDGNSGGLGVYGSWWPVDSLFVDVAFSVETGSLDMRRIVGREIAITTSSGTSFVQDPAPAPVDSEPHRSSFSWDWRAGYDLSYLGFTGGPRLGFSVNHSRVRDYAESGDTPMTLRFDTRRTTSLQSVAGLQVGWALPIRGIAVVPQLNLDLVHEFANDQQLLRATFAEDLRDQPSELRFLGNAPDRGWRVYRASIAASLQRFSAFLAYQKTSGHSLIDRYQASLGLRLEL
jgi:uncharacterized protein YhjY with autotransporter beta-barrel domain